MANLFVELKRSSTAWRLLPSPLRVKKDMSAVRCLIGDNVCGRRELNVRKRVDVIGLVVGPCSRSDPVVIETPFAHGVIFPPGPTERNCTQNTGLCTPTGVA